MNALLLMPPRPQLQVSQGNNSILAELIQTLLDCSNSLSITLCSDASATVFLKDTAGYPIKKRSLVSETYLPSDGLTFQFNTNTAVTLKDSDAYWYKLSSNPNFPQIFDVSASTPLTPLHNATFIQEINTFFDVVPDLSENTYIYNFFPVFDPSMDPQVRMQFQQTSPKNFISLYLDPSGTLPELDDTLFSVENRFIYSLSYAAPVSPGASDTLTIVFGNGTKMVSLGNGTPYWYTASVCYRKPQDLSGNAVTGRVGPSSLNRIQYPDHEKLVAFFNSFSNNRALVSVYTDVSRNDFVNDNLSQPIDNRIITTAVYTPAHVDETTGETAHGYATLEFGNNSTLTITDTVDNNWYSIRMI